MKFEIEIKRDGRYIHASALGTSSAKTSTEEAVNGLLRELINRLDKIRLVPEEYLSDDGRAARTALKAVLDPVYESETK